MSGHAGDNYYRDADGNVIGPDVFIGGKPYEGTPLRRMSGHADTDRLVYALEQALERSQAELALSRNLYDELFAQTQRLRVERDRWREYCEAETVAVGSLRAENQRLRDALNAIINELGVPQPGYPQPVANAYDIAYKAHRIPAVIAALDGTPSAAQTLEDPTPDKEKAGS